MATHKTPAMNTAMEIVKGSMAAVLGFPIGRSTLGSRLSEGNKGRITVMCGLTEQPSDAAVQKVMEVANETIEKDVPVYTFTMSRSVAEGKYGDAMFDKFEVPAEVTELTMCYIEGLNLHASPNSFLPSTGQVGEISITKLKFRGNKQEMEIMFSASPLGDASCVPNPSCEPPSADSIGLLNSAESTVDTEGGGKGEASTEAASLSSSEAAGGGGDGQNVTPWAVEADKDGIDYTKLVKQFGSQLITEDLIAKVERLTNKRAHRFLRRGLFFSHRDLAKVLHAYEKGEKFYLYTGRGPSSESLHMGHMIPFQFTQYLQEAFDVPLVIQLTDDEKFLFKDDLPLEEAHRLAYENAKDIIACGFDPAKTFIFSDLDYIQHMYPMVLKIQHSITFNAARGFFGFTDSHNIGCQAFPAVQAAPSFPATFPIPLKGATKMPCLIPCAIDQDAYFRLTRDVAPKLGMLKPALIHSKFFPGLQGPKGKMSASVSASAIYVTDTPKQIKKKVGGSFSGGQETLEEHREKGANIEVDVAYQYLTFFLEDDDEHRSIGEEYAAGRMLTCEVKQRLIDLLTEMVTSHQERRSKVTEEMLAQFMAVRPLEF